MWVSRGARSKIGARSNAWSALHAPLPERAPRSGARSMRHGWSALHDLERSSAPAHGARSAPWSALQWLERAPTCGARSRFSQFWSALHGAAQERAPPDGARSGSAPCGALRGRSRSAPGALQSARCYAPVDGAGCWELPLDTNSMCSRFGACRSPEHFLRAVYGAPSRGALHPVERSIRSQKGTLFTSDSGVRRRGARSIPWSAPLERAP